MATITIDFDEKEDFLIGIVKAKYRLGSKAEAVKKIVSSSEKEVMKFVSVDKLLAKRR